MTARLVYLTAARWYENQQLGLGRRFRAAVDRVTTRIADQPAMYARYGSDTRCARVPRFPYGVFYCVDEGRVVIVAVYHLHRDPHDLGEQLASRT